MQSALRGDPPAAGNPSLTQIMSDPVKAVFLSYASQDTEAARKICEALRASGVEVWFDVEGGLEGGDEWDAKIRRQIKECVLFIPIISANTQAREEGYFRIEWELAVQRSLGIAAGVAFILPVVIDDTREAEALVPDRFRSVQWTRLRGGEVTPDVTAKFLKLWSHRTGVLKHQAARTAAEVAAPVAPAKVPRRALPIWVPVGAALALVAAGAFWWQASGDEAPATGQAAAPSASVPIPDVHPPAAAKPAVSDKSVAVMPFSNLSEDRANEYFSDGVSEELLNVLAKVPGLKVPARTSSFHFKGKNVPLAEVAAQLGVAYIVEGSVRRSGERVRITAQLIKAADGYQMWSETFTRDLKDVFAVQDEIARLVAQELQLKLIGSAGSVSAAEPLNPEAFRLYLEARQAWNLRNEEGLARAERLLGEALKVAPRFARAHSALADVWIIRAQNRNEIARYSQRNSPILQRAETLARQAAEMDPNCAEAYATLGNVAWMAWRSDEAVQALGKAIALNPNYATAHQWLGRVQACRGDLDAALSSMRLAHELDPLSTRIADNYSLALQNAGRYEQALVLAEKAIAVQPNAEQGLWYKAMALAELNRPQESLSFARDLIARGFRDREEYIAYVFARCGASAEALDVLQRLGRTYRDIFSAHAYLLLGMKEEAYRELEADGIGVTALEGMLFRPVFDPLRAEPRFQRLLQALGLTEAHDRAQRWRAANGGIRASR
jgi:TolB-like protein/Tfp pilus assembly protein PilF